MSYFSKDDWARVRETYSKWWNGTLSRPIIKGTIRTAPPPLGLLSQANVHDMSKTADDIIDLFDQDIKNQEYRGDAFPFISFDSFGPGVVAAFLGAELNNETGRVWFSDPRNLPIEELHFEFDPNNRWLLRLKDIYAAGIRRWNGSVLMGMTDLGGELDILASFRGTETLLFDLYDYPEQVERLCGEIRELWFKCYNELNSVLFPINPGYSDWAGLYSAEESYVLQSDFSYMISPEMFEQFVLPSLSETAGRLTHSLYHLDGVGELPHLDMILGIDKIQAVQWVPGDGAPSPKNWPQVYQKIAAAGKGIHIVGDFKEVLEFAGTDRCYVNCSPYDFADEKEFEAMMALAEK